MRRLMVGLVALVVVGALGGFVAGAVTKSTPPAAATSDGSLASIVVVRSDEQAPVDVATPVAIDSARFRLTVPKGRRDLFDVRFSGAASFPNGASFPVAIDVTVDGIAMPPSSLPAWQNGVTPPIPFQVERALGPLASGTYDIGVQIMGNPNDHREVQLLGWTLVAQRTPEKDTGPTPTSAPSSLPPPPSGAVNA
jgi:hypothetical protein